MKLLTLLIAVTIAGHIHAQADSANQRVSGVILKGRESDIVCYVVKLNPAEFPVLDSIVKAIYVNKPANGDNVTFNAVPNKEWVRMIKRVSNNPTVGIKNSYDLIRDALLLNGGSFVAYRVGIIDTGVDNDFTEIKKIGQNYAQRKGDGDDY